MDPEKVLDEILYILWTGGAPWRSLNAKGASHFQTVHGHFMAWARKGVFKRAYAIALRLTRRKGRRNQYYCIDTTFIKSIYGQDCVGRNPTGRGRNATKLSAMVVSSGLPVSLAFFPANVHDVHTVDGTLRNRLLSLSPSVRGAPLFFGQGVAHLLWRCREVHFVSTRYRFDSLPLRLENRATSNQPGNEWCR
jgi:hypothetical protein